MKTEKRRISRMGKRMTGLFIGLALLFTTSNGCSTSKSSLKDTSIEQVRNTTRENEASSEELKQTNTSKEDTKIKVIEVYDTIGVVRREVEYSGSRVDTQYIFRNVFTDRVIIQDTVKTNILSTEEEELMNKVLTLDEETRETIIYSLILVLLCIIGLIVLRFSRKKK